MGEPIILILCNKKFKLNQWIMISKPYLTNKKLKQIGTNQHGYMIKLKKINKNQSKQLKTCQEQINNKIYLYKMQLNNTKHKNMV